jgi:crotonobetainyl-CoA:carnitine CoA-transferase CaiB-like acyl-CoA transferase
LSERDQPFEGLRVVDVSTTIGGAYATKMLRDAGADVVLLESDDGHPLRRYSATDHPGTLFQFLSAGKRSVRDRPGRLEELSAKADLVVASQSLDLDVLSQANPTLSLATITPWGTTGPFRDRPANEFTLQAAAGSTAYRGLPGRGPVAAGGQLGEWAAGAYGAVSALAAVLSARQTGHGVHADVSMFEVAIASLTVYHDLQGQWFEGPLRQSLETPSIEPTKDGWVGLCAYTGQQWKDFCLMVGRPEVADDERYFDARSRMEHLDFIQEVMHTWTRTQTTDEVIEVASAMRIPVAAVGNGQLVLEEPHYRERGVFVPNPAGFEQPRRPWLLSDNPAARIGPVPTLGGSDENIGWETLTKGRQTAVATARPLEGIRVVELAAFWAGPVVGATLADWGADVVKVESIQRPDGMRFAGAVRNDIMWEWSPVYHGANVGKRAITLDLDSEEGKRILRRLIEEADVLTENFSARVMDHFGLDWETLHAWNPRLCVLRMPAWGLDGPWRDRVGFAASVEQASGLAWITGYEDMPLIIRGACDPVGGMHALMGLLAALEDRRKTGEGQLVECALVEPALNLAAEQIIEWSAHGELLTRQENRGAGAAPQGCYRCAGTDAEDRGASPSEPWVAIAVTTNEQWTALDALLGQPNWAAGAELASERGRRAHHEEIDAALDAWCSGRSADEAASTLLAAGIPASPLWNAHFVVPNPQLDHRAFHQIIEHPVTGPTRYPGFPARFSGRSSKEKTPPPTLGQHNVELLAGKLGLSDEEIERLVDAKVIGTRPAWL